MSLKNIIRNLDAPTALLFAERLNHVLDLLNCPRGIPIRADKLVTDFAISVFTAKAWLNGLEEPDKKMYEAIADIYKINLEWLQTGIREPLIGKHPISGFVSIPQIPFGKAWNYQKLIRSAWIQNRIAACVECSQSSFAFYIDAENLESMLFPGDSYFIIDPQACVNDKDIVLAVTKHNHRSLLGYLTHNDDLRLLGAFKPGGKPYYLDDEDIIVGPAAAIITHYMKFK